jgi:Fe-S-cluster containining protein
MDTDPPREPEHVSIQLDYARGDYRLRAKVVVPKRPARADELLPLARSLSDKVVSDRAQQLAAEGRPVSCKKGCAACCRLMVPVSEIEARRLRDLVEQMPEPRRSQVRERFADVCRQLARIGLLDRMKDCRRWTDGERKSAGFEYFLERMPCPFLEEESCSIYGERPISCREYIVKSPPENCAQPPPSTIQRVPLPVSFFSALSRFGEPPPGPDEYRWLPLVMALEWAATHPDETRPRPGPELLRELLAHTGRVEDNTTQATTSKPPQDMGS